MKNQYPLSHEIMIALARKCRYSHYQIALDFEHNHFLKFDSNMLFDYCYLFNAKNQLMAFTLDRSVNQENLFDKLLSKKGILVENKLALNDAVGCMTYMAKAKHDYAANKNFFKPKTLFKFNQLKEEIIISLQMEGYL